MISNIYRFYGQFWLNQDLFSILALNITRTISSSINPSTTKASSITTKPSDLSFAGENFNVLKRPLRSIIGYCKMMSKRRSQYPKRIIRPEYRRRMRFRRKLKMVGFQRMKKDRKFVDKSLSKFGETYNAEIRELYKAGENYKMPTKKSQKTISGAEVSDILS